MYHNTLSQILLCSALLCSGLALPAIAVAQSVGQSVPQLIAEAEEYALSGDFDAALPLYEKAIARLAKKPQQQQQLRYRYGIVLNALGERQRPDLYPLARVQFAAVLQYLENDGQPLEHSAARVRSALAHTYHQQAGSEEQPGKQAQLLRNAYGLYRSASGDLKREGEWQNLAITYFNLGQVCEWQGNLEEAIDWIEKAVELDSTHGFADLEEDRQYLLALRQQANPQVTLGISTL